MTQKERLDYLVGSFKDESPEYKRVRIPEDTDGKQRLLRSLMNVRMPKPASAAVLAVQTVTEWLGENPGDMDRIIFNVFKNEDRDYYEELL